MPYELEESDEDKLALESYRGVAKEWHLDFDALLAGDSAIEPGLVPIGQNMDFARQQIAELLRTLLAIRASRDELRARLLFASSVLTDDPPGTILVSRR